MQPAQCLGYLVLFLAMLTFLSMRALSVCVLNETSLIVSFSDEIDEDLPRCIAVCLQHLQKTFPRLICDYIPSFTSLVLEFDTTDRCILAFKDLIENSLFEFLRANKTPAQAQEGQRIEIPVYYGEEVALDAMEIAAHVGKDFADCVALHSQVTYQVYAVGFTLGFAYLGMLDPILSMPRKSTPRLRVPAGSLAIADRQTAIYPRATPGGWHIIGRSNFELADLSSDSLVQMQVGDQVSFTPISRDEFIAGGGELS